MKVVKYFIRKALEYFKPMRILETYGSNKIFHKIKRNLEKNKEIIKTANHLPDISKYFKKYCNKEITQ